MSTETKQQAAPAATPSQNLQERYKPLGLRAVLAAAMQAKADTAKADGARRKHDRPAVLEPLYD